MKKLYTTAFAAIMGLFLMSFTTINQDEATYNVVSDTDLEYIEQVGSFSEYERKKYGDDKTLWKKRYKTWTEAAPGDNLESFNAILNRN